MLSEDQMRDANDPALMDLAPMPWVHRAGIYLVLIYCLILLLSIVLLFIVEIKTHSLVKNYTILNRGHMGVTFWGTCIVMLTLAFGGIAFAICGAPKSYVDAMLAGGTRSYVRKLIGSVFGVTLVLGYPASAFLVPAVPVLLFGQSGSIPVVVQKTGSAGFSNAQCASGAILRWPDGQTMKTCLPLALYVGLRDGEMLEQPFRRWHDMAIVSPLRLRKASQD